MSEERGFLKIAQSDLHSKPKSKQKTHSAIHTPNPNPKRQAHTLTGRQEVNGHTQREVGQLSWQSVRLKSQAQHRHSLNYPARQGIFLPESAVNADSLIVFTQPPCAIARINICVHVNNPQTPAATPLFGPAKHCKHW